MSKNKRLTDVTAGSLLDSLLLSASSVGFNKTGNIVEWCENFYYVDDEESGGLRPIKLAPHQKRIFYDITEYDEDGRLPYTTIVYSCPKKSGKTALAGMFGLWYAFNEYAPNEIYVMANDLEQSQGRIFRAMWKSLHANPATQHIVGADHPLPSRNQDMIILPNGTFIQALSNDYAGAAGSNHGLTLWSELWGFFSENSRRLWDELTPVPTRKNSIRYVETYAGFLGESELLEEIYRRMVEDEKGNEREDKRIYKDGFEVDGVWYNTPLPVYVDKESKTYVYWDTEPRMPWQTEEYYAAEAKTLRPSAFIRLHRNSWVASTNQFISSEMWRECEYDPTHEIWGRAIELPQVLGADASTKKDKTGLISVSYDPELKLFFVRWHKLWEAEENELFDGEKIIDLEETIKKEIIRASENIRQLQAVYYDPYQLHAIATDLKKRKIEMVEFPQHSLRMKADSNLYTVISQKRLVVYPDDDLRNHVTKAKAKEYEEGKVRITKGKSMDKVDLAVALSMAVWGAEEQYNAKKQWKKLKFASINTRSDDEKSKQNATSTRNQINRLFRRRNPFGIR